MIEKTIKSFRKQFPQYKGVGAKYPIFEDNPNYNQIIAFLSHSLSQCQEETREEIKAKWDDRIFRVKRGLTVEYGKGHNYTPNYEGIFEDILQSLSKPTK